VFDPRAVRLQVLLLPVTTPICGCRNDTTFD
jgi:hypothetical protein